MSGVYVRHNSSKAKERAAELYETERPWRARYGIVAGVDEVGRGPMAGPVVAAAVILKERAFNPYIDDSKRLSPRMREDLFDDLLEDCASFGVGIRSSGYVDKHGIVDATFSAMRIAIGMLAAKGSRPGLVIADGFRIPDLNVPQKVVIKADSKFASVACASIIAKVTRDRIMSGYDSLYPEYGFARHKGYCTQSHRSFLYASGPCPIHRRSFTPVALELDDAPHERDR